MTSKKSAKAKDGEVILKKALLEDGSQIEFVLEKGDGGSSPQFEQDGEDMLLDLQDFSGKVRLRKIFPDALPIPFASSEGQQVLPRQIQAVMEEEVSEYLEPSQEFKLPSSQIESDGLNVNASVSPSLAATGQHQRESNERISAEFARLYPHFEDTNDDNAKLVSQLPMRLSASQQSKLTGDSRSSTAAGDSFRKINPRRNRRRENKRASMRVLAQLSGMSDTKGQTTLHHICASPSPDFKRVHDLVEKFPDMVKKQNEKGQLPLHVLGNNSDLVSFVDGQKVATKCALLLMDAYPESIIEKDGEGHMPFTYLIFKWIEWTFDQEDSNSTEAGLGETEESHRVSAGLSGAISKLLKTSNSKFTRNSSSVHSVSSSRHIEVIQQSSNRFPPVLIFEEVEWCFEMLSIGMDHLGGKPLDPSKRIRPQLAYPKQRQDRSKLAENVAEIPCLLKTILLLESQQTRSYILDCSAIRRCLLCPLIIGPWLTSMLSYKKGTSAKVTVDFLKIVSKLRLEDYVGGYRKALPRDEQLFQAAKLEVYEAVEVLQDVIPSLLIAGEELTDHAVATPLIWFIMNRKFDTPFTVGVGLADFLLHITAMLAFRQSVLGFREDGEFFVLFPWMSLNSVIFWIVIHHILRKGCEYLALARTSLSSAKKLIFGGWNVLDLLGIILAMWTAANIEYDVKQGEDIKNPLFIACILGLLWLRMLLFLKVVNEPLATFVLALTRILFDIRFFTIVLGVFILMFGDMFQVVVQNDPDTDCSSDELDPAIEEFCSPRSIESYLRAYAMVVGDIELKYYNNLEGITFLWFCATFMCTIVMLNVLIAVVQISYDRSQEVGVILFRRARAQFLAGLDTIESFLRPTRSKWADQMPVYSPMYIFLISMRWIVLLTYLMTSVWSSLYLIEVAAFSIRVSHNFFTVPAVIMAIAMIYTVWSNLLFTLEILVEQLLPSQGLWRDSIYNIIEKLNENSAAKVSTFMFGIDRNDTEGGGVIVGQNPEVLERLDRLEGMIEQLIATRAREEDDKIEATFEECMPLDDPDASTIRDYDDAGIFDI